MQDYLIVSVGLQYVLLGWELSNMLEILLFFYDYLFLDGCGGETATYTPRL